MHAIRKGCIYEKQVISLIGGNHEGSSLPWILASEVVIHNSCATGIEAFGMEIPVVSYRPFESKTYDSFLPNAVSREAHTETDLVNLVKGLVSRKSSDVDFQRSETEKRELANQFFSGLEGPTASECIIEALRKLNIKPVPFGVNPMLTLARQLAVRSILPTRAYLRRKIIGPHPQADYYHQKFPSLELSEVREDLHRLNRVSGRFGDVNVSEICETLFCLISK